MNRGWICLQRELLFHWLWQDKPFAKGQAWVDLLLKANYRENKFLLGNSVINAKKGMVVTSTVKLAEDWGWSRTKVTSFLNALETDAMVTLEKDSKKTVINIVNYEAYQEFVKIFEQQKDIEKTTEIQQKSNKNTTERQHQDNNQTSTKHQKDTNNKVNKENKVNQENNIPPFPPEGNGAADSGFDEFWKAYPKKADKPCALRAWKKLKPNGELQRVMLEALEKQKQSPQWQKEGGQFIPYPATWLNGRRWEDGFEQFPKPPPKQEFDPNDPYKAWRDKNG